VLFNKDLPKQASVMVHTQGDNFLEAYRFLERSQCPTLVVSLHRPIVSLQRLLHRQGIPTHNVLFMDTVSKRANAELLPHADYLFAPDLTELSKRIVQRLADHHGEKIVLIDAISSLRHWYTQPVINNFVVALQSCLRDMNSNLIVLNDTTMPALPNARFDQIVEL